MSQGTTSMLQSRTELAMPLGKSESPGRRAWKSLRRNPLAIAGMVVVILMILMAIFAPVIAPYDYASFNRGKPLHAPSADHWFGTDRQTRDVFSRVVFGARVSLSVGAAAVALILTIGIVFGTIAGYIGGLVDNVIMRVTDVVLAIPQLFLLIVASALFTPGLMTTMLVIGLTSWMGTARIVRGEFLRLRAQDYVTAARSMGASHFQIMRKHLLPNTMGIIIVQATLWLSAAILVESSLSFLGLGVQPPNPSWGGMLSDARNDMQRAWWGTVFPGLAIFITVFAFTLLGDGLRDALDPRHRKR